MSDVEFRAQVAAGLIAVVRAWGKGLTGAALAREVRRGLLMVVGALEKRYPELAPPDVAVRASSLGERSTQWVDEKIYNG